MRSIFERVVRARKNARVDGSHRTDLGRPRSLDRTLLSSTCVSAMSRHPWSKAFISMTFMSSADRQERAAPPTPTRSRRVDRRGFSDAGSYKLLDDELQPVLSVDDISAHEDAPRILVCRGVDCAGLGSAATLLELEGSARARDAATGGDPLGALTVCATSCTNLCAFAPTVSTAGRAGCESYKQVDSARRCADVLGAVTGRLGPGSAGSRATPPADGPMRRRRRASVSGAQIDRARRRAGHALLEAIAAEKSAAGGCPRRLARAARGGGSRTWRRLRPPHHGASTHDSENR